MNKHTIAVLYAVCCFVGTFIQAHTTEKALRLGTIQFPHSIRTVPSIRVYYAGQKVPTQIDSESKKITFTVSANEQRLHVVVTPHPTFKMVKDENTIECLKVDTDNYKYFFITFVKKSNKKEGITTIEPEYEWNIKSEPLHNGRIPDDALIICYDPQYINAVNGGNAFELPYIQIHDNILQLVGSESQLQDLSTKLLLSCIDFDTVHATIHREIKRQGHPKTILAMDIN